MENKLEILANDMAKNDLLIVSKQSKQGLECWVIVDGDRNVLENDCDDNGDDDDGDIFGFYKNSASGERITLGNTDFKVMKNSSVAELIYFRNQLLKLNKRT